MGLPYINLNRLAPMRWPGHGVSAMNFTLPWGLRVLLAFQCYIFGVTVRRRVA